MDSFTIHDIYMPKNKKLIKSIVKPLTCYVCKKELNGVSITGKTMNGRTVFLCSYHFASKPNQIALVS